MRSIGVQERRARLAIRHALAPGHRAPGVVEATRRLVCLHATDPSTVFLSAWARVDGMERAELEAALYEQRSLVKHMAMRRTLFVVPREQLAVVQAGASDRVAGAERRRLIRDVERAGLHADGTAWLARAEEAVLAALDGGREATSSQLREEIPALRGSILYGEGRSWGGQAPVGPRVLTVLSAAGRIVRASNDGSWAVSRPRWTTMADWLGEPIAPVPTAEGVSALVRAWLEAFGPGTAEDIRWWLGSTAGQVRRALSDVGAVEVDLGGRIGHLLPGDLEPPPPVEPWGALLPGLDPTTMGWIERDFYLGPHKAQLFDSTGNGGPAIWWDGRIAGGWRQDDDGVVVLQWLEDVGTDARALLDARAEALTRWLGGARVMPRFPSPLFRGQGRSSKVEQWREKT